LLTLDYKAYSLCLAKFFEIDPIAGETIALDGKVLRGSYNVDTPASTTESHPAIQLVTVYIVERGLILPIQPVDKKSNEITALPSQVDELGESQSCHSAASTAVAQTIALFHSFGTFAIAPE
jgi:hypothetical protein